MIKVRLNRQTFQYDVHSLVKAFYPRQEVRVDCGGAAGMTESGLREGDPLTACRRDGSLFTDPDGKEAPEAREALKAQKAPEALEASGAPLFELEIWFWLSGADQSRIDVRLFENSRERLHMENRCRESERIETKNELKRMLYRALCTYSGKTLPWGDLTGIRPTKIPMSLLNQGMDDDGIAEYMQKTYYISSEKTALAIEIANRERSLLKKLKPRRAKGEQQAPDLSFSAREGADAGLPILPPEEGTRMRAASFCAGKSELPDGYSLYIGIPFCPSICLYCSFSSSPIALWRDQVDSYLDALCHEIDCVAAMLPHRHPDAVYIGGGTPTTLEPEQMERLLQKVEEHFDIEKAHEFTVEAGRPDSITREKLLVLKRHGVTRISINPQTMNQETLDFIGRRHTTEQTREAFDLARSLGFDNINMDLIVGLPGEGAAEVERTLQEVIRMDPDDITVHSLAVKRAARLRLFSEEHQELSFENSNEIMDMTAAYARRAGLLPYYLYRQKNMAGNFENVGYAKEGREGLYNILIMEEIQSIIALGAGAATKLKCPGNRIERIENVKDIRQYIDRIDEMIERKRKGLYE